VATLCEKNMTTIEVRSALIVPHNIKQAVLAKTQNNMGKINKHCTNCGMTNHNVETSRKKKKNHNDNHKGGATKPKNTEDIFICMSHLWFEWT
jgi:hypothetical protein